MLGRCFDIARLETGMCVDMGPLRGRMEGAAIGLAHLSSIPSSYDTGLFFWELLSAPGCQGEQVMQKWPLYCVFWIQHMRRGGDVI